jgi:NADH dehydrogenase FAD-containing subunit
LASGDTILEGAPEPVSKLATAELQNLNVTTRFNTKVSAVTNSKSDDRATLTLSSGDKLVADLYIPTFGLKPNTSYMPSQYLNNQGYIIVDEFFRLKGVENVFAIGDCSAFENSQFVTCDRQSIHLSKNVVLILSRKAPLPYYPATKREFSSVHHPPIPASSCPSLSLPPLSSLSPLPSTSSYH